MSTYTLQDAENFHKLYDDWEHFPSREKRQSVPDNHWCLLAFRFYDQKEKVVLWDRLWVQVNARDGDAGSYYGTLGDHPKLLTNLRINASIQFEYFHIFRIMEPYQR